MKKIYFTPGPSQLYPSMGSFIESAMKENILSLSHRSREFEDIYSNTTKGIRNLFAVPNDYKIVFLSSATEAMERIIQNTVNKNSFHITTGAFGEKFFEIAKELGKNPKQIRIEYSNELQSIKIPNESELICITQNETSNGFSFPIDVIDEISNQNHDKLIAVDVVSSVPFAKLNYKKIDMAFFSVQKGFGLPAGLGVLILSPRAINKAHQLKENGITIGSYHNFINLIKYGEKNQTYETPNVLGIYLLNKVISDIENIGLENIRKKIILNAKKIYNLLDNSPIFDPLILNSKYRSATVIVVKSIYAEVLRLNLSKKNIVLGGGYGNLRSSTIRIANFPTHTNDNFDELIHQIKTFEKSYVNL